MNWNNAQTEKLSIGSKKVEELVLYSVKLYDGFMIYSLEKIEVSLTYHTPMIKKKSGFQSCE